MQREGDRERQRRRDRMANIGVLTPMHAERQNGYHECIDSCVDGEGVTGSRDRLCHI